MLPGLTVIKKYSNSQDASAVGRLALREAFACLSKSILIEQINEKIIEKKFSYSDFNFSLSHSDNIAIAWLAPTATTLAIGVDVEPAIKEVSPRFAKTFRNDLDLQLTDIALWSAKEACFKSLSWELQNILGFSQIIISEKSFFVPAFGLEGDWLQCLNRNHIFSYASLKRLPIRVPTPATSKVSA